MRRIAIFAGVLVLCAYLNGYALPQGMEHSLDVVKTRVKWVYYDGYTAEIAMQQVPVAPDVVLVDALLFDPENMEEEPMSLVAGRDGVTAIGVYCEASFAFEDCDGIYQDVLLGSGDGNAAGEMLESYYFARLPEGISPDAIQAEIHVGVSTQRAQEFEQRDLFDVRIPKADRSLLHAAGDWDLGSTRIRQVTVSCTPRRVLVSLLHQPALERGAISISVYGADGTLLEMESTSGGDGMEDGQTREVQTFSLGENQALPSDMRIQYTASQTLGLQVHLSTGEMKVVQRE